jgi:hypothetical protein
MNYLISGRSRQQVGDGDQAHGDMVDHNGGPIIGCVVAVDIKNSPLDPAFRMTHDPSRQSPKRVSNDGYHLISRIKAQWGHDEGVVLNKASVGSEGNSRPGK